MPVWRGAFLSAMRLAMLSVLIETKDDEEGLARTLASLVGGAVEGVVRDVIVCDRGSTDQTRRVAEHAGCNYIVASGVAEAIRQAKSDWLLILEPGARLVDGWIEPVLAHAAKMTMPARFSRSPAHRAPFLSRIFSRPTALAQGLVITKRQATVLSRNAQNAEGIARGLATRKLDGEILIARRNGR